MHDRRGITLEGDGASDLQIVDAIRANPVRLLLRADDLAELIGCSARHVWALDSAGRIPRAIKLGKLSRWSRPEVEAWVKAGCPQRDQWESTKDAS